MNLLTVHMEYVLYPVDGDLSLDMFLFVFTFYAVVFDLLHAEFFIKRHRLKCTVLPLKPGHLDDIIQVARGGVAVGGGTKN